MEWNALFDGSKRPALEEIELYINSTLWTELNSHIQSTYKVKPQLSYSKCSAQPGWNIKYRKSGRSLCTLYPMNGFFIALIVIGNKETNKTELMLPTFCEYVQNIFKNTKFACGGRWLMIQVTEPYILQDVKRLINIRAECK